MKPAKDYGLSPFEKGIDFFSHFTGKEFTLQDIASRYDCTYRSAQKMKEKADYIIGTVRCGQRETSDLDPRREQKLWKFRISC